MKKKRLAFDQLESRNLLCSAFGDTVSDVAHGEAAWITTENGTPPDDHGSDVGRYKSGGYVGLGFDSVRDAVQHQVHVEGGVCNPPA